MRICAVICELNPFHNGHKYIFAEARKVSGADKIIAIMSGNFVQRALPAVTDEYSRAECALLFGADAVIELPTIYATAAGERFASGAIGILNSIDAVDTVVMGAETPDVNMLGAISELQAEEPPEFKAVLREALSNGSSYARALTQATALTAKLDPAAVARILEQPNNILAVEYKKALIKTQSKIRFLPIPRISDDYVCSASDIRKANGDVSLYMPRSAYEILMREKAAHPVSDAAFGALVMNALRSADIADIASTPDCAEGLEYKIKRVAEQKSDYESFLYEMSSVRYTKGRIMRICLQTLLGIKNQMLFEGYDFARLLGIKKDSDILGALPCNILKTKRDERYLPKACMPYLIDKRAADIYSLISSFDGNVFYRKMLKI